MILDLLVSGALTLLTGLLGLFPAYDLPGSMTSLGSELGAAVAGLNGVVPVVTIGVCLGIVLAARLFIAGVALVQWVYGLIPFN